MAAAMAVAASSVIGCITAKVLQKLQRRTVAVEDGRAAIVRYPVGETGNGGEWKDRRLHDAKSRFEIMQTFSYLMLSSLAPASLCFKFKSQLGRLFRAQEVFVYLPLDNDMMPSERSATQVVMMEGAVLALSKTNTHPDVQLLPEEDTVLAVPIFLPDDVHEGSFSSIPFLHTKDSKEIYGCVELVNRRTDTKLEEDLELLNALCTMLCHAAVRAVKLRDAVVIKSLPPLTQVEFFGETSILPEKTHRRTTLPADFPVVSPSLERRQSVSSITPAPAGLDGQDNDSAASAAASVDRLPEPTDMLFRISAGSTGSNLSGMRHALWTNIDTQLSSENPLATVDAAQRQAQLKQETSDVQKIDCIDGDDFPLQMSPEVLVEAKVEMLLDWNFDVLLYDMQQLIDMAVNVFDFFHLTENFGIPRATLRAFITTVLHMYQDAPFHNFHHAFHVFQNCMLIMYSVSELQESLSSLDAFSLLVASLCHDMDHTGTNNTYHINTWSQLSIRYNDMSVMEQHHSALCFAVLTNPQTNIMRGLTLHSRSIMRKIICHAILSTDMNNHTKNLESFTARHCLPFQKGLLSDRMMLVGMLLHTADLGNPCMGNKHCKEWEKRISQEFLFQATLEIEQGLPVAPFMLKCDMLSRVENQNHFMTHFAYPQWKAVVEMFPILAPRFNQLKTNIEYFYVLKKTLEENPELMDPRLNEMSVRGGTSIWDVLEEHGEDQGDQELGEGEKIKKRRNQQGRLSRLTQPGASDLIHMWDEPHLLPDVYDMRRRGGLPDVDQEVKAYLWEEMLPPLRSPQAPESRRSMAGVSRCSSSDSGARVLRLSTPSYSGVARSMTTSEDMTPSFTRLRSTTVHHTGYDRRLHDTF